MDAKNFLNDILELIYLFSKADLFEKSGALFAYKWEIIGQGRENAKIFIEKTFKTKEIEPTYLASITLLIATIITFPFIFFENGVNLNQPKEVLLSVGLLGSLCTGMAYMGYVILIKRVGPIKASTVVLIVPVTGMLWANIFLDEIITLTMISGCVLILIGVGLVNFFKNEET